MILSKQKWCLLLNGVSTESKKLTSVRQIRQDFFPTRNMTRIHFGLALSYVKLLRSLWKIYICAYWWHGMEYQQIVGIPMGTNCAPPIADLFLYCYERNFMSNLQESKRFDLIDKFNDTSRYLDDIFTIDNPAFAEYIPDIYQRELQLNKANTSDKEISFWDLNIKVIGYNIRTSIYDERDDFGFPIVNSPGWVVMFLDSYHTIFTFRSEFDLLDVVLAFFYFHSKNLQITSRLLTHEYRFHKLRKTFGKFFRSYSKLLSKFCAISFQEYVSKGITHPVFYGDLVYKLRRVKRQKNFISSAQKNSEMLLTSSVWPGDHREDYRSCAWPLYSLVQIIL